MRLKIDCSRNTGFQWITFPNVELYYCILLYQLLDLHICITNTGPLSSLSQVQDSTYFVPKIVVLLVLHQNFCNCTSGMLHLKAYTSFTSQIFNMYSLCITNFRLIHLSNFGHKCQICACTICTLSYM